MRTSLYINVKTWFLYYIQCISSIRHSCHVYSSIQKVCGTCQMEFIKKFFCKFTLTPSHSSQPPFVYRGFKCEGKCEGVRVDLHKKIYSTL